MEELRPTIQIGHESGARVRIQVLGRLHPDATDYWDGNWLMTLVNIVVGSFVAEISADLRANELDSFRQELAVLYSTFGGSAVLRSLEGWLDMTVSMTSAGSLQVDGHARDSVGRANELSFHIDSLDQTDLPSIIDSLEEVGVFYPMIGSP
jgi:hypothetical protein